MSLSAGFTFPQSHFDCMSSAYTWGMMIDEFNPDDDAYLEDGLVVPVGVDLAQLARNPVVLPHKQGVEHRQHLKVVFHFNFMVIRFSKRLDEFKVINLFFHEVR